MFEERSLDPGVAAVREEHAPGAMVFDCERDFETLPTHALDDLATFADAVRPREYDSDWVPADGPEMLRRLAGGGVTVGMPGDGSVAWTTQTDPPAVLVKPRVEGSPGDFVAFLVAEALVEAGLDLPEHFLGFFRETYPDFAAAVDADPAGTYQVALACGDAYRGLRTREVFRDWADDRPRLHDAWTDAGERLEPRLADLPGEMARGETDFADAAELACSGVKHDPDLPAPFAALNTVAYTEYGPEFAVKWARKVFD